MHGVSFRRLSLADSRGCVTRAGRRSGHYLQGHSKAASGAGRVHWLTSAMSELLAPYGQSPNPGSPACSLGQNSAGKTTRHHSRRSIIPLTHTTHQVITLLYPSRGTRYYAYLGVTLASV
jgi:hypothetical protein